MYSMAAVPSTTSPTSMADPLPVVGPQFCKPYVVVLTITKKAFSFSGGDFAVSDVDNGILMKVEGNVGFRTRRVLYDAAGTPIISMRRKVMSMSRRWNVYRGDSDDQRDFLFTVKESNIVQLTTKLDVFLAANTAEQRCDFKVKESWFGSSSTFYLGDSNTVIARMSRQYELKNMFKSTFQVTVYPNVDYAFVVATIVILQDIHSDRQN